MIPGFVTLYRDNQNSIHLYFYPGLSDDNHTIYNNIDLSEVNIYYKERKFIDGSVDYRFDNADIIKIHCKLVKTGTNEYVYETLQFK